jgi:hypothetical protein
VLYIRPTCVSDLILFLGGAERLVVDAAVGLQKLGHTVPADLDFADLDLI